MYALFGMIALVATPVFGALCLYNKATHKKDNRMLIAFFASFAVLVICLAVTPEPSHDGSASSSVVPSSAVESVAEEPDSGSDGKTVESASDSDSASQEAASETEHPASSEPASSEQQVASSASSHNPDDDIPILDLDDYAKQAADNAVKAKDKYAGKQYKVTYQVNSVSDMMVKTDNPYTVMFSVNFVTSHSIGYTVYMAGFAENERDKISRLSPGQTVTFVGDFDGNKFTDCRFIVP
nr:MAG TPA_asm: putative nucleic acid-binding lipoprotein.1, putative nucleic acid-binding lipoprotein [Caudoviricetes sp.]